MIELNIITPTGAKMPLVGNPYFVPRVEGMTQYSASIATSTTYNSDGDSINNIKGNARDIIILLEIRDNADVNAAYEYITQYIKPKQTVTLEAVRDGQARHISGVLGEFDMPRFVKAVTATISLYCSQPFWEDAVFVVRTIETVQAMHHFEVVFPSDTAGNPQGIVLGVYDTNRTRTFTNSGHVAVGMEITIIANGTVVNPVLQRSDGQFIGIYDTLTANDEIIISTVKRNKTITKNGVNILNKIMPRSTFMQLEPGENIFTIDADGGEDNMYFTFQYKQRYI